MSKGIVFVSAQIDTCRMNRCKHCNGIGIIRDSSNNDLPCDCSAGGAAMFTCAELGLVTGAQLRDSLSKPG